MDLNTQPGSNILNLKRLKKVFCSPGTQPNLNSNIDLNSIRDPKQMLNKEWVTQFLYFLLIFHRFFC